MKKFFLISVLSLILSSFVLNTQPSTYTVEAVNPPTYKVNPNLQEDPAIDEFVAVEQEPLVDMEQLQKNVKYPEIARKSGIEGTVIVRALINTNGKVIKTVIEQSDVKILEKPALTAVKKTKFQPAILNKALVKCWVTIPIKFRLK